MRHEYVHPNSCQIFFFSFRGKKKKKKPLTRHQRPLCYILYVRVCQQIKTLYKKKEHTTNRKERKVKRIRMKSIIEN